MPEKMTTSAAEEYQTMLSRYDQLANAYREAVEKGDDAQVKKLEEEMMALDKQQAANRRPKG
jgi:uncharacterized membrane protein (DUF106 family)